MRLPWVSRAHLDEANKRAEKAVERADLADIEMWKAQDRLDAYKLTAEKAIESLKEENQKLIDRILSSAGQAPIFSEVPAPTLPLQPTLVPSTLPGPEPRVSFNDVHREARKAIKDGTISTLTAVKR